MAAMGIVLVLGVLLGVPVAIVMLGGSLVGMDALGVPSYVAFQRMSAQIVNQSFLAIPFFLLVGELLTQSKLADRIMGLATALVGHWRAGIAQSSLVMSAGMATISGSGAADAAATGAVFIPNMKKRGYRAADAAAVVAAGSVLGPIIPPSIVLIIYGSLAEVSVRDLMIAAIVPGVFILAAMMLTARFVLGRGPSAPPRMPRASLREVLTTLRTALVAIGAPALMLVGIFAGWFTATEAGAVACVYVLIAGLALRTLNGASLLEALKATVKRTAAVMLVIAASTILAWIAAFTRIPQALSEFLLGLGSPILILLLAVGVLVLLGTVIDPLGAAIIMIPLVHPIGVAAGLDPIHFAISLAVAICVGGVTPPVGTYLFITAGIAETPITKVAKAVVPYLVAILVSLLLIVFIPGMSTALPALLR